MLAMFSTCSGISETPSIDELVIIQSETRLQAFDGEDVKACDLGPSMETDEKVGVEVVIDEAAVRSEAVEKRCEYMDPSFDPFEEFFKDDDESLSKRCFHTPEDRRSLAKCGSLQDRLPTLLGNDSPQEVAIKARSRLPSFGMDLERIDSGTFELPTRDSQPWWSAVPTPIKRLQRDMPNHGAASEVLKVMVVPKPPNMEDTQLHWFDKYREMGDLKPGHRYLVTTLVCGKAMIVVLSQVVDEVFESVLQGNFLNDTIKFVVQPVNLPIPIPLKGARDAVPLGQALGMRNVRFARSLTHGIDCASLTIDLYSSFMLRMAIPSLAFKEGRITDFHFVSYKDRATLVSFRLAFTKELLQQLDDCAH